MEVIDEEYQEISFMLYQIAVKIKELDIGDPVAKAEFLRDLHGLQSRIMGQGVFDQDRCYARVDLNG